MKFSFRSNLVALNIDVNTKEQAILALSLLLQRNGLVGESYQQRVIKREHTYPTGLATKCAHIAIPHAFDHTITGNSVAVGFLKHPVNFHNMEDMEEQIEVDIIFLLAIAQAHKQLEMLQIIMKMLSHDTFLKELHALRDKEEVCKKLNAFVNIN